MKRIQHVYVYNPFDNKKITKFPFFKQNIKLYNNKKKILIKLTEYYYN